MKKAITAWPVLLPTLGRNGGSYFAPPCAGLASFLKIHIFIFLLTSSFILLAEKAQKLAESLLRLDFAILL